MKDWAKVLIVIALSATVVAILVLIPADEAETRNTFLAGLMTILGGILAWKTGGKKQDPDDQDDEDTEDDFNQDNGR